MDRVGRVLENIRVQAGSEVYAAVLDACGTLQDKASREDQAEYIKRALNVLEKFYGTEITVRVMRPNGHQCISNAMITRAKAAYKTSTNMEEFLVRLNEQHIGGGRLHMRNGRIIGIYEQCYCWLPKKNMGMPEVYCNCSAGWFERLFSSVFGKAVEVKILHTILGGADQCEFEILPQMTEILQK